MQSILGWAMSENVYDSDPVSYIPLPNMATLYPPQKRLTVLERDVEKTAFEVGFEKSAGLPQMFTNALAKVTGKFKRPVHLPASTGTAVAHNTNQPLMRGMAEDATRRGAMKAERAARQQAHVAPVAQGQAKVTYDPNASVKAQRVARRAQEAEQGAALQRSLAAKQPKTTFQKGFQQARIFSKKNPIAAAGVGVGAVGAATAGGYAAMRSKPQQQQPQYGYQGV